jgi:hypothetical protein
MYTSHVYTRVRQRHFDTSTRVARRIRLGAHKSASSPRPTATLLGSRTREHRLSRNAAYGFTMRETSRMLGLRDHATACHKPGKVRTRPRARPCAEILGAVQRCPRRRSSLRARVDVLARRVPANLTACRDATRPSARVQRVHGSGCMAARAWQRVHGSACMAAGGGGGGVGGLRGGGASSQLLCHVMSCYVMLCYVMLLTWRRSIQPAARWF